MKKLLSLLSILAISGTAIPTTIAASPYQKEEQLNSEIASQIHNLKINKNKRSILPILINEKIKFIGYGNLYKGHISLNYVDKKILFLGNNEQFHFLFDGKSLDSKAKVYNKITIKDQNNQIIKEIIINGTDSMQDVINKYNLQNGINYQDGYLIEIWSAEPIRTKVLLNNTWYTMISNDSDNIIFLKIYI